MPQDRDVVGDLTDHTQIVGQSAAVVVGRIDSGARWPFLYDIDLRVDDSPRAPELLSELVAKGNGPAGG